MEEGHLQLYTVYSTMYIYTVPAQAALTYGAWHVKLATFIVFFHTHKKYQKIDNFIDISILILSKYRYFDNYRFSSIIDSFT